MWGPASALLGRSLRVGARHPGTHLLRGACLTVMLVFLAVAHARSRLSGAPGLEFFRQIVVLNVVFLNLAALGYFTSAVTEEKEEGTLGLLRMAGIGPLGLLLGKSTSRLVSLLLILVVQLPFVSLAVTLGGITTGQVLAAYVVLAAHLVLIANLALFCSVVSRRTAGATLLMAWWLAVLHLGAPALNETARLASSPSVAGGALRTALHGAAAVLTRLEVVPRLQDLVALNRTGATFRTQEFWPLLAGAAAFAVSWGLFDRFTRDHLLGTAETRRAEWRGRAWKTGRAWGRGYAWKEYHFTMGGWPGAVLRCALLAAAVAAALRWWPAAATTYPNVRRLSTGEMIMFVGFVAAGWDLLYGVSRIFADEVSGKTLSVLMLLPARLPEKACGKVAGVLLGLAPALVCIGVGAAVDPAEAGRLAATLLTSPPVWVLAAVYLLLVCLTGALSITVRWGAIPLAVGLTLFPLLMLILLDHPRPEPAEDAALAVPAACLLLLMSAAAVYAAGMQLNRTAGR